MKTVGNYLKSEREARNMSLRDASRLTCITEYYLGYIERDEFDKLPQGPYIKGYITLYSETIGTDVDKVLDLYESLNMQDKQVDDFRLKPPQQNDPSDPPFKSGIRVYETPPPDTSSAPPNALASATKVPDWAALKTKAIAWRRKCTAKGARAAKHLAALWPKGMHWLSMVVAWIKSKIAVTMSKAKQWLDTVVASIKANVTAILPKAKGWLDAAVALTKGRRWPRAWLYLLLALIGACILVLAGFGFYHLFLYDKPPTSSSARQQSQAPRVEAPPAKETVKSPVASKAAAMPPVAGQPKANEAPIDSAGPEGLATEAMRAPSTKSPANLAPKAAVADRPAAPSASVPAVKIAKASICTGIKDRLPSGVGNVFSNANKRVYVWSQVEARRIPNQIRHIYYLNDQVISDVALGVDAAHWRTWSFVTISDARHRGEWRVDITAADGKVLRRLYFKIR